MNLTPTSLPLLLALVAVLPGPLRAASPKDVNATIKTLPAQMRYDTEHIIAEPGAKVTITLDNVDDLPHNVVLCLPKTGGGNDKGMEVAQVAWAMGEAGMVKQWIPDHPRIIAYTKMIDPHQKGSVTFTAPEQEGDYPYVCTFPGHAMVMNGLLTVAKPVPPIRNLHFRYYTGKFDKIPDFSKLTPLAGGPLPDGKCDITTHKAKSDFAYEFEGSLECPKDGEYKFAAGGDDGFRVFVDGKVVVEHDGIHPFSVKEKRIKLAKGERKILVHYFQQGGEAEFFLGWSGPSFRETALSEWVPNTDRRETEEQKYQGIPLVVKDEPVIYRNFIRGSGPRGIAVGYPGGINLCWDADQMNLVLIWQGAFMDAKRHWTGRGAGEQPPLGYDVATLGQERALAFLASPEAAWAPPHVKEEYRNPDYRFLGYELDAQRRPMFRWQYKGVKVEESFTTEGGSKTGNARLTRTLRFTANPLEGKLYFLALSGSLEQKDGSFIINKFVKATLPDAPIQVRKNGPRTQVILPVEFKDGSATLQIQYAWNAL